MTVSLRAPDRAPGGTPPPVGSGKVGRAQPDEPGTGRRPRHRRGWGLVAVVAVVGSLVLAGWGRDAVVKPDGASLVGEFFAAALQPRADAQFLALVGKETVTTLSYAVLGTALSLVLGVIGGVLTSQTWWEAGAGRRRRRGTAAWMLARGVLVVPRGIHEVVWGLFFLVVFGLDPLVAVLAIGIPFGAVTAKVFSELLDETSRRPYAALRAAGAGKRAALLYGLLPPAMSDLLSYGFYRFECAIRSATILGLIGAGGLGFQIALSFQTLRYQEIWTLLYALILMSVAADFWSSVVRSRRSAARRQRSGRKDPVLTGSLLAGAGLVGFATWWIGLDVSVLWEARTWELGEQLLAGAWPPVLGDGGIGALLELGVITLAMSIVATAIAFCGGCLLAFPAANLPHLGRRARNGTRGRSVRLAVVAVIRLLLIVLRTIPPPIWALLFLFVLFPGILPGALALGVYTAGVLGRLMAEAAENLDGKPLRALRAHGASETQVFCYAVVPAATPRFVAYGLYRWEVAIRETVVVGVVGAGGLGLLLDQQLSSFYYGAVLSTLIALIVLTLMVDLASAAIRRSLR
jgi:phosphonate transport system permease protein